MMKIENLNSKKFGNLENKAMNQVHGGNCLESWSSTYSAATNSDTYTYDTFTNWSNSAGQNDPNGNNMDGFRITGTRTYTR